MKLFFSYSISYLHQYLITYTRRKFFFDIESTLLQSERNIYHHYPYNHMPLSALVDKHGLFSVIHIPPDASANEENDNPHR